MTALNYYFVGRTASVNTSFRWSTRGVPRPGSLKCSGDRALFEESTLRFVVDSSTNSGRVAEVFLPVHLSSPSISSARHVPLRLTPLLASTNGTLRFSVRTGWNRPERLSVRRHLQIFESRRGSVRQNCHCLSSVGEVTSAYVSAQRKVSALTIT